MSISIWKRIIIAAFIIAISILGVFNIIKASSCCCVNLNTNNLKLVAATCWVCISRNSGDTVVRDEVKLYYADGITEVDGCTILPIFVINYGQVQASKPWYEDDDGLCDPNGPTMVQYINITNNPFHTWIECWAPSNAWKTCCYKVVTKTNTISTFINLYGSGITTTASSTVSYKVYRIVGRNGPTPNQNHINIWCWALNETGTGWWADTKWTWPTMTLIYTPANGNSCPLWPKCTINFVVLTEGNFWCCLPWNRAHLGAGWEFIICGASPQAKSAVV
jgi:hypothetical protein